jgi:VCBS repeat-containing protein
VTIVGENDGPTVAGAVSAAATEDDTAFSVNLLDGANDDDDGAVLSVQNLVLTGGDDAGVTVNGNSLDLDPNAYNSLAVSETEVLTYSYTVVDEHGALVAQSATITIQGVNDAPVAADDFVAFDQSGNNITADDVLLNDTDVDNGAVLTVSAAGGQAAGTPFFLTSLNGAAGFGLVTTAGKVIVVLEDFEALALTGRCRSRVLDQSASASRLLMMTRVAISSLP